jgi:arabinofuranan 3-O-arabinosyltransferase
VTTTPLERKGSAALSTTVPEVDDQVVTVAQTANRGWTAQGSTPITVHGWMQGWITGGGQIDANFAPAGMYRVGLGAGGLLVLATLLLAWRLPSRPVEGSSRTFGRVRIAVLTVGSLAAAATLAGTIGLVAFSLGVAVVRVLGPDRSAPVAAAAVFAAGGAYVLHPWNSANGWAGATDWPQWLVLLAVGVVVGIGALPMLRRRMAGRSTTR